jgi:hypothetical protein
MRMETKEFTISRAARFVTPKIAVDPAGGCWQAKAMEKEAPVVRFEELGELRRKLGKEGRRLKWLAKFGVLECCKGKPEVTVLGVD